jgi:drug/metabolite transporter (DMT)-like permease
VTKTAPYAALVLGILGLAMSAIFVKWANAPGAVSGFFRVSIAAVALAVPFGIQLQRRAPAPRRYLWLAVLAGIFFAGDLASWNTAILMGNAANATLLANTSPFWVALGALWLFKEKLAPSFWFGLLLVMLGALLILGHDFLQHPALGLADLLALLAGLFYGGYFLATQRARDRLSSLVAWWVSTAASAVALFVISVALEQRLWGFPAATYWNLAASALVTQVGAYLSISYALGRLPASVVAPTLLAQPVLTAILGVPLLDEPLAVLQIVGGFVVLGGIWMVHRKPGGRS